MDIRESVDRYRPRLVNGMWVCDCKHSRLHHHDPGNPCRHVLFMQRNKGVKGGVEQTSLEAYIELVSDPERLNSSRRRVLLALDRMGDSGFTDMEITRFLGLIDPNMVRPRRNDLADPLKFFHPLVVMKGKRVCSVTGRLAKTWCLSCYGKKLAGELRDL